MSLRDVLCQEKAIGSLMKAVRENRLAHAYIFAGEEGVGKFTTAREFARMLLCLNPKTSCQSTTKKKSPRKQLFGQEDEGTGNTGTEIAIKNQDNPDSCGLCESCRLIDAGTHPDFQVVYKELIQFSRDPENRKRQTPIDLPIDVIREFLIDRAANRPKVSDRTVFIVRQAETMNPSGQNAMLKILEEPPKHCTIILLCTQADDLLPTIRSRCQMIRFGPVKEEIVVDRLAAEGVDRTEAGFWARFSRGSLGLAGQWAKTRLSEGGMYAVKRELVDRLAQLRPGDVLELAEWLVAAGKEIAEAWGESSENANKSDLNRRARKALLRMMIAAFEDAMGLIVSTQRGLIHADQRPQIEMLAKNRTVEILADWIAGGYEKIRWIDAGVNEKLIFEQYLFCVCGCDIIKFFDVE
jgi:DNA polymerase III delta prime subunit